MYYFDEDGFKYRFPCGCGFSYQVFCEGSLYIWDSGVVTGLVHPRWLGL